MGIKLFFYPISYGNNSCSIGQSLLEKVDHYFYLGGKKAIVIAGQFQGNSQAVILDNGASPSLLELAFKIASYLTLVIPLVMLAFKVVLRTIYSFHLITNQTQPPQNNSPQLPDNDDPPNEPPPNHDLSPDDNQVSIIHLPLSQPTHSPVTSDELIQQFWKEHVCSFKISHGTTALYYNHFKEHGISPTYPAALGEMIEKVRKLWGDHEHDIVKRTVYFIDFENRCDQAERSNIAISFSAQAKVTEEFTIGVRQCGEWMKEVRYFLTKAKEKQHLLSTDDRRTIVKTEALIHVMSLMPPMIVKIDAGCPHLGRSLGYQQVLGPLDLFSETIKKNCQDWKDPSQLLTYLNSALLPELEREKERLTSSYEITLHSSVPADYLEFEFLELPKKETINSDDYPRLDFDKTQTISSDEIAKLEINDYGFSQIEEYQDSQFELEYAGYRTWSITRRALEPEIASLMKERKAMEAYWLKVFGCNELMSTI